MGYSSRVGVGSRHTCNGYGDCVVVDYNGSASITVRFDETGYETKTTSSNLLKGLVKDYLQPSVCGVGYNTLGKMLPTNYTDYEYKKIKKAQGKWNDMLRRCYVGCSKNNTYKDCMVSEEWHDFANFWKWFDTNCDIECKMDYHLDKDLISKGNKTYSKENCFLVPRILNNLLTSVVLTKKDDSPAGIHFYKNTGRFQAYCNTFQGVRVVLGYYDTAEEAFYQYKLMKESVIKEAAEFYRDTIDEKLYHILMNYELHFEER